MECIGQGGGGSVWATRLDGKECAVKKFEDQDICQIEHRAYKIITTEPSLRGRVCDFFGTLSPSPRCSETVALVLARLFGPKLSTHLRTLTASEDREPLRRELHETLDRLHHVGIAHGDISDDNIIIEQGRPVLIDFSHALFQADQESLRWDKATRLDHACIDGLFRWADSDHATNAAIALLDGPTPPDQQTLAGLLDTILKPGSSLILRIHDMFPTPTPTLALAMATHLSQQNRAEPCEIAVNLMLKALADVSGDQQQSPPSTPQTRAMHRVAARAAVQHLDRCDRRLSHGAEQLYRDAVAAHEGACAPGDLDFLRLRVEWARFLAVRQSAFDEALDVCAGLLDDLERLVAAPDADPKFKAVAAMLANLLWMKIVRRVEPDGRRRAKALYVRAKKIV